MGSLDKVVLDKIEQLRTERGWTVYRLAERSGITDKCIYNWYKRGTMPTIQTLKSVCDAFGITLSQFFAEGDLVETNDELKELFRDWIGLTDEQKTAVKMMIKTFKN